MVSRLSDVAVLRTLGLVGADHRVRSNQRLHLQLHGVSHGFEGNERRPESADRAGATAVRRIWAKTQRNPARRSCCAQEDGGGVKPEVDVSGTWLM